MYLRNLLVNWNVCRLVRIIAGVPILVMGIQQSDGPVIAFGAIFTALGLFTTQCCSTGVCSGNPIHPGTADPNGKIEFEEIK